MKEFPDELSTEHELEELLSEPTPETVEMFRRLSGDLMILGASGKMGLSLARMAAKAARRAGNPMRVIAVARFSEPQARTLLENDGIETIAADLLDYEQVLRLPRAKYVLYLVGRKFGSAGTETLTWATNAIVPAYLLEACRGAYVVAFSTGCVYPLVPVQSQGCSEQDPVGPVGEYAWSCLARERVFEFLSTRYDTPVLLYRLNYANAVRYGVLTDLATTIARGEPVDLSVEAVNLIWQGDANNFALRCLEFAKVPPEILNITGPEKWWIRDLAMEIGRLMNKPVTFCGSPTGVAYLSDASRACELFGAPRVPIQVVTRWTARWVASGKPILGKPTHFQVTDGQFLDPA